MKFFLTLRRMRSAALWLLLISLALPGAYYDSEGGYFERGWALLLVGWLNALDGNFAWYANVPLLIALALLVRRPGWAASFAFVAIALGSSIFDHVLEHALDSAKSVRIIAYGAAPYFWLAGAFLVAVGGAGECAARWWRKKRTPRTDPGAP